SDAPAQWVVEPPTALTIHAGSVGKFFDTRQLPDVVRGSFQASWVKLAHSSLMKSVYSWRSPASSTTTLMPFCASSLPSVPPPAPEPMITTTLSSFWLNVAAMAISSPDLFVQAARDARSDPIDVVKTALDVAALRVGFALVAEDRPHLRIVVEGDDEAGPDGLEHG